MFYCIRRVLTISSLVLREFTVQLTPTITDRYTYIVFCICSRFSFICKRNSPNTDETLSWSMSEKCARNILQPVKNVLLRRFRNFARNHVRFKGTERPTMKLLALSAEIPSPENLYIPPPVSGMKCCSTILDIIRKKEIRATNLVELLVRTS